MQRSIGWFGLLLAGACASNDWKPPTARDIRDVPAELRPGFGNVELHTWWPLTEAEAAAMRGVPLARQGDAHALLALAIVASGDRRDVASHAAYQQRVDQFLAGVKPTVDAGLSAVRASARTGSKRPGSSPAPRPWC